jgi:tetratricopeptide (TPR) repeat protein
MPMPKGHSRYDYNGGLFADELATAMLELDVGTKRLARESGVHRGNKRTLIRVLEGRGASEEIRYGYIEAVERLNRSKGMPVNLDRLYTSARLTRRELLGSGLQVSVAAALPRDATSAYRRALADGKAHLAHRAFADAVRAFERAARLAPTDETQAEALARQALASIDADNWQKVRPLISDALHRLNMADLSPDRGLDAKTIIGGISELRDQDTAMATYYTLAMAQGMLHHLESHFGAAVLAYETSAEIAGELGEDQMLIESLHLGAKSEMEGAVIVDQNDIAEWRTLPRGDAGARAQLDRSIRKLEIARGLCGQDARLWKAHNLRVLGRAYRLRGEFDKSASVLDEAAKEYGRGPARMNLQIDRGRNLVADGEASAIGTLDNVLDLAQELGSETSRSAILSAMSSHFAMDGDTDSAKSHCAAALLSWKEFETRDSGRALYMFRDLEMSLDTVRAWVDRNDDLLRRLQAHQSFDLEDRLAALPRRLDAAGIRVKPA